LIIHEVFIKIVLGSLLHFVARARARAELTLQLLVPVNRASFDSKDNRGHNSCIIAANGHFPAGI